MPRSNTYEEFVDKFKPKKTTDDCYTPGAIYEVVNDWAIKEMDWGGRTIVRPFGRAATLKISTIQQIA